MWFNNNLRYYTIFKKETSFQCLQRYCTTYDGKIFKKWFPTYFQYNLQHYVDNDKQEMELIHNITKIKRPLLYIRHVYFIRFNTFGKAF